MQLPNSAESRPRSESRARQTGQFLQPEFATRIIADRKTLRKGNCGRGFAEGKLRKGNCGREIAEGKLRKGNCGQSPVAFDYYPRRLFGLQTGSHRPDQLARWHRPNRQKWLRPTEIFRFCRQTVNAGKSGAFPVGVGFGDINWRPKIGYQAMGSGDCMPGDSLPAFPWLAGSVVNLPLNQLKWPGTASLARARWGLKVEWELGVSVDDRRVPNFSTLIILKETDCLLNPTRN